MKREKGKSLVQFQKDFCVIDIETTGLDPQYDEIIEICALRIRDWKVTDVFSELVKPSESIDEFIEELTGITNEMVANAPDLQSVLPSFLDFIASDVLVGHNINFDINFLYDMSEQLVHKLLQNDFCDTMRLARIILPELDHHRLKDLCKHYSLDNKQAHRAESDCRVTLSLYSELQNTASQKQIDLEHYFQKKILRAADLSAQITDFDETHPLYDKLCVFTGALEKMTRKEAMQAVLNVGGQCSDSVTKKTDYLILGTFDYCSGVKGNKSGKQKKAEELILKGNPLTILSESTFYDLLNDNDRYFSCDCAAEMSIYDKLIGEIKQAIESVSSELNLSDGFLKLVENQKTHSVWIIEPVTQTKSQMILTVTQRGRANEKFARIEVKTTIIGRNKLSGFTAYENDASLNYCDVKDIKESYATLFYVIIKDCAERFIPADKFGCCEKYRECSAAKKCLHDKPIYAKACWYRKNLEQGKIFY